MKPKHRHELKTNELAEWLSNFPQWVKENLRMIIYVSVLIIVVAGVYLYNWYSKNVESVRKQVRFTRLISQLPQNKVQILRAQQRDEDISFLLLRPASELKTLAETTKNDQMAALALIKHAEIIRIELHYRLESVSSEERQAQLNKAKKSYINAFNKAKKGSGSAASANTGEYHWGPSTSPLLMARARFGEGLCEEELGNFAAAETIYRQLPENTSFEGTTAVAAAAQRLATMADYQKKIIFRTPPAPEPAGSASGPVGSAPPMAEQDQTVLLETPSAKTEQPEYTTIPESNQ